MASTFGLSGRMQRNSFLRPVAIDLTPVLGNICKGPEKQAENALLFVRRQWYANIMKSFDP